MPTFYEIVTIHHLRGAIHLFCNALFVGSEQILIPAKDHIEYCPKCSVVAKHGPPMRWKYKHLCSYRYRRTYRGRPSHRIARSRHESSCNAQLSRRHRTGKERLRGSGQTSLLLARVWRQPSHLEATT